MKNRTIPTCHPDRKHCAKGLCVECYRNAYAEKAKLSRKRYEASEKGKNYKYSKNCKDSRKRYYYSEKGKAIRLKYKLDKDCISNRRAYFRNKYKNDINHRLSENLRKRLIHVIKNNYKSGSAVRDLGCTLEELRTHLESLFQPGMTWDNWSKDGWHIDHIIPLAYFDLTDREQLLKACHYTNLQPLWAKDNIKKGSKYEEEV